MVGAGQLLPGVDKGLVGKTVGTYTFDLPAEEGFGRKNPKLIQLIATSKFHEQKIAPQPGLQVEVDGAVGIVRSVAGGRTIVDFNHPLSGKEVVYTVTVKRIITDEAEKLASVLKKQLGMTDSVITLKDGEATVGVSHDIPPVLGQQLGMQIVRMIPSLKKVSFVLKDAPLAENKESSDSSDKAHEKAAHSHSHDGAAHSHESSHEHSHDGKVHSHSHSHAHADSTHKHK